MKKVRTTMNFNTEFKDFLDYLKATTRISLTGIVEISTIKKYNKEYKNFIESKEKET